MFTMKKLAVLVALIGMGTAGVANAAAEASATATWSATAKKDTTSKLVVTALNSLTFDYAAGVGANGAFNTQKGLFDVKLTGDATQASDFKLSAQKVSGTLNHLSTASTVEVGVLWNGAPVTATSSLPLIDTANGLDGNNLSVISLNHNVAGDHTAQESFTFNIEDGTTDGSASVAGDYSQLPDGIWSGEVKVKFIAEWL